MVRANCLFGLSITENVHDVPAVDKPTIRLEAMAVCGLWREVQIDRLPDEITALTFTMEKVSISRHES